MNAHHRPPLDELVYKIRFRRRNGSTHTMYYSDPKVAERVIAEQRQSGSLLYVGLFTFKEEVTHA